VVGSPLSEIDRLESALWEAQAGGDDNEAIVGRLEMIVLKLRESTGPTTGPAPESNIETVSVDELLDIIDEEFDLS